MKKLKEIATNIKFWIAFVTICVVALTALGATVDRPVWLSEVQPTIDQAGANQKALLRMQIDQLTRSIWAQEDRLRVSPNQDGKQRLRELKEQRKRIKEMLDKLGDKG